jgi:hypothetical protein
MDKFKDFIKTVELGGFITGESLVLGLFKGDEYPKHLKLPYEESNAIFDSLCDVLDLEHITVEQNGDDCRGIIRIGDIYYAAKWESSEYRGDDPYGIEDSVIVVTPTQKTITVYEDI